MLLMELSFHSPDLALCHNRTTLETRQSTIPHYLILRIQNQDIWGWRDEDLFRNLATFGESQKKKVRDNEKLGCYSKNVQCHFAEILLCTVGK